MEIVLTVLFAFEFFLDETLIKQQAQDLGIEDNLTPTTTDNVSDMSWMQKTRLDDDSTDIKMRGSFASQCAD